MAYITIPDQYKQILGMTADEYAKQQTAGINNQTQQYLTEYDKAAELRKQALNTNKQNVVGQIQSQIPKIQEEAKGQSKQAYINNMLSTRDMGQKLSQAGLSNTGVVGSAYGDLSNAYAENVNNISMNKSKALRDVDKNIANTELEFAGKEQSLLADIQLSRNEMMKYNNELANNRYQQSIDNFMKYKEYEKFVLQMNQHEDQMQAAERDRQRNYTLAQQEIELKKKNSNTELQAYLKALELSNNKQVNFNKTQEKTLIPKYNSNNKGNPLNTISFREAVNFNNAMGLW